MVIRRVPSLPVQLKQAFFDGLLGFIGCGFLFLAVGLSMHSWKLLVNPVICMIGKLSFSIYLVHWVSLAIVTPVAEKALLLWTEGLPFQADWVRFGCVFALVGVSVLLAWPLNVLVEKPCVRLGQKWITKLKARDEAKRVNTESLVGQTPPAS